jgi:glutamyl/glutaminyl-tRNA synthetase
MKITHVIRGEEWIPSTPKHIILYNAFGWPLPVFAHLPLLLNPDKSKLSKRQGDVAAEDYLQKGYLPESLLNFIALLGWNPGTNEEIFSLRELIKEFNLIKVQKSGAVFNIQKLNWLNGQYIKKLPSKNLLQLSEKYLNSITGFKKELYNLIDVINLCHDRLETLDQIGENISFIYTLPDYSVDLLIAKKSTKDITLKALQLILKELSAYQDPWQAINLLKLLETTREKNNLTRNEMFWPLRVAVSGQNNSPDVFAIMQVLQKTESLRRISLALEKI